MNDVPQDETRVDVPARDNPRAAHREAARRRRLAQVFGEVLPTTTSDEGADSGREESGREAWLRSQVPPHHGTAG